MADRLLDRFDHVAEDGLKRDPGCHIRTYLAFTFGRLEYTPAIESLRQAIRTVQIESVGGVPFDTAAQLRANAALALAQLHAPDALRDISLLLFERTGLTDNPGPRKAAAQALARLADPAGLVPLSIRLRYPERENPEVLVECMEAAVALEDPRAVETLRPFLDADDQHLAAHAALMLARLRADGAERMIGDLAARLSGNPLKAAILALLTLRTERAAAILRELARSEREPVRLAVVEALAGAPDEDARSILHVAAEEDASDRVRVVARRALEA